MHIEFGMYPSNVQEVGSQSLQTNTSDKFNLTPVNLVFSMVDTVTPLSWTHEL